MDLKKIILNCREASQISLEEFLAEKIAQKK